MSARLCIAPLTPLEVDALAALLRDALVYRHLGGVVPDLDAFRNQLTNALTRPPPDGEVWLNFGVRRAADGALLGRLEATVHHGLAEVAFLFGPRYWGQGYATEGLCWLNDVLLARPDCHALWAATLPGNTGSRALLLRAGYTEATAERPPMLQTFDDGDLAYRGPDRPLAGQA